MNESIRHLQDIIDQYTPLLQQCREDELAKKPLPEKWSKKELIGHLIDSAQNNLRRFIVAQYEDNPFIVYKQDEWVRMNHYQQSIAKDLVLLWSLLNRQIVSVLENTPAANAERLCLTEASHSIAFLVADYNRHMLHHLHQVLDLEPVDYPGE
jgi:hypothetical protein